MSRDDRYPADLLIYSTTRVVVGKATSSMKRLPECLLVKASKGNQRNYSINSINSIHSKPRDFSESSKRTSSEADT